MSEKHDGPSAIPPVGKLYPLKVLELAAVVHRDWHRQASSLPSLGGAGKRVLSTATQPPFTIPARSMQLPETGKTNCRSRHMMVSISPRIKGLRFPSGRGPSCSGIPVTVKYACVIGENSSLIFTQEADILSISAPCGWCQASCIVLRRALMQGAFLIRSE